MNRQFLAAVVVILACLCCVTTNSYACNQTPIAEINGYVTPGEQWVCVGTEVELDGSESWDWDGYIIDWWWDIFEWNSTTEEWDYYDYEGGEITSYTFSEPGLYCIVLWVQDDDYDWCDQVDTDWCIVGVIYGHPVNFSSVNCGGPPSSNHYGASIYYVWSSTTGDNCDLANCEISEEFCDYYEDRPPFYAGSAPPPRDPLSMDILFNGESLGDDHGIRKDLVHDYRGGVRSYGQFLKWECAICGASGTLSTVAVGFIVYDNASSPPPNDWYMETRIIPDCPGWDCETDEDIPE